MFSAFLGGFLGASIAMHSAAAGIVSAIMNGVLGLMLLMLALVLLLWFAAYFVYYVVFPVWRFVVLPALLCFIAVICAPYYIPFILLPWCVRKLFGKAQEPLWHPFRGEFGRGSAFDGMTPNQRCEWVARHVR